MQREFRHKRGDTFSFTAQWAPGGVAQSLAGATVRAQLRDAELDPSFSYALTVTLANQTTNPGEATFSAPYADTETWPLGLALGDIEITTAGVRQSSEDFAVRVVADRSR